MPKLRKTGRARLVLSPILTGALFVLLAAAQPALATDRHWTGTTGSAWSLATNWDTLAPVSTDNAVFNGTFSIQPNLTLAATAGGLWMTGSVGQNVTISGSTLTLNGNTINGTTGLGILVDNSSAYTLTINAPLTLGAAQTWRNNSSNVLTVGGAVNTNNQNLTIDGTGNTTIGGIISANGQLIKNGSGTLILSGANTYGAVTTINAGIVNVQNNTAFGASNQSVTVASGAAIQLQNGLTGVANNITISGNGVSNNGALENVSGSNTLSGNITLNANSYIGADAGTLTLSGTIGGGGGGVTIVGNGTVVFSGGGDNNYSGTTEVKSGTLLLSKSAGHKAISGPLTIDTGTLVQYTAANQLPGVAVTLSGSGHLDLNGFNETNSGGLIFTGGSVTTGAGVLTIGGGAATITTNASSSTATISGNLNLGGANQTFTIASGTAGTDMLISAAISGNHNFAKAGAGVLNFSGANTYTGTTTISAGRLQFAKEVSLYNDTTASWTATNIIVASGATAAFNVGGTGEFTSSDLGTLIALGTSNSGFESGSILGLDTTNASGGTFTYSSNIGNPNSGANVLGLNKLGTGTLVLSGTNTYSGATTVSAGILNIQNASALGTTASGTTVVSGATLQLQNNITVGAEALTISGNGASGQNGALVNVSGTNNYGGLLALGAASTISSDGGTLNLTNTGTITGSGFGLTLTGSGNGSIASIIGTGSGVLTKSGGGTWTLSGANTYTGGTNINGGTLSLGSSGAIGSSGTISFGGGTLQSSASNTTDYSARFSTTANQAYSIDTNSQSVTLATVLTSSGGSLTKLGSGTLTLSAANTYSGGTTISAGTLKVSGSGTFGSSAGSLTVNGGTVDLYGTNQGVGNLTGSGGTIVNNSTGTNVTLTIGNGNATGGNYAGVIANGTGTLGLVKAGSGTITLSGTNTFTGATVINGGTLVAAGTSGGALGSTTSIQVNSSGTLLLGGATNQINDSASMTLNGGTLAKGGFNEGSTSAAGIGALTLQNDSHIDFGTVNTGILTFATLTANSHRLTIDNWTGTYGQQGTSSTDRLIFDQDETNNLNDFFFTGYGQGGVEFSLGNGFWEIVAAVPEPQTWIAPILVIMAIGSRQLLRFSKSRERK